MRMQVEATLLFAQAVVPPACLKCPYSSIGKRTTEAILRITQHLHTSLLVSINGSLTTVLSPPLYHPLNQWCHVQPEENAPLPRRALWPQLSICWAARTITWYHWCPDRFWWLANCRSHSNCVLLCEDALNAHILSGLCVLTVTMNNKSWVTNKVKAAINREEKLHFIEGTRTGIKMLNGN